MRGSRVVSPETAIIEHMCECMQMFTEPTRAWFMQAFASPTDVQREAWPAISAGKNVLAVAPTGAGKTLAAFLWAIDSLMAASPRDAPRKPGVTVLYVSPLKALGTDVARNLQRPLAGIDEQRSRQGVASAGIRVAIRSGDTNARDRRKIVSHPPDILVTTPESLYLMLTSKARHVLRSVRTVIIDEIHAIAGTKRGAHLALSLQRLDLLTAAPAQRIGLSATVRPVEQAARFLSGSAPVSIIDPSASPAMDVRVIEPVHDMRDRGSANSPGAPRSNPSTSIWPALERQILDEVLRHHTTLVFVNSRGLAERLTARLNDLYGQLRGEHDERLRASEGVGGGRPPEDGYGSSRALHYDAVVGSSSTLVQPHDPEETIAMAHHGSVSKERRARIEDDLKRGRLRCVVATSSLELGIDMGSIDLVIQIAPPLSVASGLQRVGRADHRVAGVSHAVFHPLTREHIIGMASVVECMKTGLIEPLTVLRNPLDVLAQQTVAAAAMDDLVPDEWFDAVRGAAPFADLDRSMFDSVLGMLTGAYNGEEFSQFRPSLSWDREKNIVSALPGAQRLAVTSGGTIADRGQFTVVLPESDAGAGPRRVGELDEEMVYESRVGDVITLGTSTWQIERITRDRVVVTPAPGRLARLPFWHGEGGGRDVGFGIARGRFLEAMSKGLIAPPGDQDAQGAHPESNREADDPPAGDSTAAQQVNAGFDAATRRRLADDGLDDNSIDNLAGLLESQKLETGLIPTHRRLVIERCADEEGNWRIILHSPYGRRVHEPWAMAVSHRLKQRYGYDGQAYAADDGIVIRLEQGDDLPDVAGLFTFEPEEIRSIARSDVDSTVLFAARFRECAARALFLPRTDPRRRTPLWKQRLRASQLLSAAKTQRNFPLMLETARECLQDVYDLSALCRLMAHIHAGTIELVTVGTDAPSEFAQNLLFGFVGSVMYQYDVPAAERNVSLLSMDPDVLQRLLTGSSVSTVMDDEVIKEVEARLGAIRFWNELSADDGVGRLVRYAKTHGPFVADDAIRHCGLDAARTVHELDRLVSRGVLLSGTFTEHAAHLQYLHKDVFAAIRSRSLVKARRDIRPVPMRVYQMFLCDRQMVAPAGDEPVAGPRALMRLIEQLQGVTLPLAVWEESVFPARMRDYAPAMLDELVSTGEVTWVGSGREGSAGSGKGDAGSPTIGLYPSDSPLLGRLPHTDHASEGDGGEDGGMVPACIMDVLSSSGAFRWSRLRDLVRERCLDTQPHDAGRTPDDDGPAREGEKGAGWSDDCFSAALWSLVRQGRVTNSSLQPIRARESGPRRSAGPSRPSRRAGLLRGRLNAFPETAGLWSAVEAPGASVEEMAVAQVEVLLDRYGVISSAIADKDGLPGGFSGIYPVLKRMEDTGRLVRGMFVEGYGAAQFAGRHLVDALREFASHGESDSAAIALDVLDPANLAGGVSPWPDVAVDTPSARRDDRDIPKSAGSGSPSIRPTRRAGCLVVLYHGEPVVYAAPRSHHLLVFAHTDDDSVTSAFARMAGSLRGRGRASVLVSDVNGRGLAEATGYARMLRDAGFVDVPHGMKLYR
jgi:ATP-dependent Lhr-like helicase